ncbi:hypothetical protein HDK64DRAFT_314092 [Phyllosticta capitalensis]
MRNAQTPAPPTSRTMCKGMGAMFSLFSSLFDTFEVLVEFAPVSNPWSRAFCFSIPEGCPYPRGKCSGMPRVETGGWRLQFAPSDHPARSPARYSAGTLQGTLFASLSLVTYPTLRLAPGSPSTEMASSPRLRHASSAVPLHHVQGRSCRAAGDIAILRQDFDIPIRPQDKEGNWAVPYDQIFDQYVDTDLLDMNSDNTAEGTSSDDLSNLFDVSSSNGSSAAKTSPMPHWDAPGHSEPQNGSQQAWSYIGQNVAQAAPQGNLTSIYPESHGRVAASDPGLFSFDQPPTCSPQVPADPFAFSSPSSPNPAAIASLKPAKKFNSLPIRGNKKQTPSVIRRTVSKGSFSPKMMRSTPYRTGYQEIWAKRVGAPPLSPPPSTKVPQEEATYGYNFTPNLPYTNPNEVADLDQQLSLASQPYSNRSQMQMTPVASPSTQDASSTRSSFHAPTDPSNNPYPIHELGEALASPPQTGRLPSSTWNQNSTAAFDFGYSSSSDYQPDRDAQAWWTPTTTHAAPQATYPPARTDFMGVSSAPSDLATGGLMINCEPAAMGSLLDAHAPAGPGDGAPFANSSPVVYPAPMFGNTTPLGPPHNSPYIHAPPPHPPTNGHVGIPLGIQPQRVTPPSRSPTNSPPTAHHPYAMRSARRDSSQNHAQPRPRSHHRRKSSGHQGGGSGGSAPRPASVGFVNYTPDDSRKILTGVAPSGSSKTKARREKEAAEKRRRLSQAAARAILEAGGDLATLEREGLLCLPETQELLKQAS